MLQFVILGLGVGAIYALGALGIVAIHRGSKILNLAHGGVAMWGAFLFVRLRDDQGVPAWAAAGLAVAAGAAFGALAYLVVLRPLRHRPPVTQVVATLGLLVVIVGLASRIYGTDAVLVSSWLPNSAVTIAGASVGRDRICLLAIALAATCALALWSARSRTALMTRALAEHERGAVALGASPTLLGALNWALGCALAALAGVLLVPILGLGVSTIPVILVPALAAALLGRFDSYWWALAGGLVIGVTESLVTRYVSVSGLSSAVPLVAVVLVLIARRDSGGNRLAAAPAQSVPAGRLSPPLAGLAIAGVVAIAAFGSAVWIDAAVTTMTYGLLGLSLVVLIGYANQISLAQMAIAGLSAFVAIKLAIAIQVPFLLAPLVGAAVGAAAGVVIGLPAVRIRGINLAVVTLATGLAVQQAIFNNESFNGGIGGLVPPVPHLFGVPVDAVGHPTRYALVVLFWTCLGVLAVWLIRRSRFGARLIAMRTNERAAAGLGIDVWRVKLAAFAASSALAGLAGVLIVYRQPSATFEPFSTSASFQLVTFVIIGGVAAISGGLAAGAIAPAGLIFTGLDQLGLVTQDTTVILGAIMLVALRVHPNGLAVWRHPKPERAALDDVRAPARPAQPLTADGVGVRFGGVPAVDGASVTVAPGEVVGLVGPNGAGKTSLLDAITGFADSSGTIALGERTLDGSGPSRRARDGLGRMFQSLELFEDLSVGQNLELATGAGATPGTLPASAWDAIARLDLAADLGRRPGELPQARRKSVALVRTLAANPAVVLLDEPGAGLSAESMRTLAAELRAIARESGIGVLIVDHDMGLVLEACDRLVVMTQGRVLAEGSPRDVLAQRDVRDAYLGEIAAAEVLA
ncbi:MAG TPA: ATP-binding cassette domain-containing protein [Conexibacter sp.]|nr:ATP-binding cassette domain-containing protein [Conexibacter sp.]